MKSQIVLPTILALFLPFYVATSAQEMGWITDIDAATSQAESESKMILLHFSAEWCRPCKELEKFVFTSPSVISAVQERLVPVHIDTDTHPELVKKYAVKEIPADVIITTSGRVVTKRKSPRSSGEYMRMVTNLPLNEVASQQQNAELSQKIEKVLSVSSSENQVSNSNDFVPGGAKLESPGLSKSGVLLMAKADSAKPQAKLVSHQTESSADSSQTSDAYQSRSKRVINDTFFVEKSVQASARQEVGSNDFSAPNTAATSKASITPRLSGLANLEKQAGSNAARILTPNFGPDTAMNESGKNTEKESAKEKMESRMSFASQDKKNEVVESPMAKTIEFALEGKCPVTLLQDGKWQDGDRQFGCVHRGRTYLFANQSKLEAFKNDPEGLSPVLAGYDPVLFHERGELVNGIAKFGVFMGKSPKQKIVLFSSTESRSKFQAEPRKFMNSIRTAVEQSAAKIR